MPMAMTQFAKHLRNYISPSLVKVSALNAFNASDLRVGRRADEQHGADLDNR